MSPRALQKPRSIAVQHSSVAESQSGLSSTNAALAELDYASCLRYRPKSKPNALLSDVEQQRPQPFVTALSQHATIRQNHH